MQSFVDSGLCKRIDLYGWSGLGGGKYFVGSKRVFRKHIISVEHLAHRINMAMGKVCVYGE